MSYNLTQYKGPLSPRQAAEGIALARANASRLIADAELLLENDRHASASALAILAIEELGKVQAIKTIVLQSKAAQLKKAWRDYRNHRAKNVHWILPKLASEGARTLSELRSDSVKQLSLYTDCYGDAGRWSEPADAVDPRFSVSILATARVLNRDAQTTERELELWATIVGPHYGAPTMIDALLKFQKQMWAEGLTSISAIELEAFVKGNA